MDLAFLSTLWLKCLGYAENFELLFKDDLDQIQNA